MAGRLPALEGEWLEVAAGGAGRQDKLSDVAGGKAARREQRVEVSVRVAALRTQLLVGEHSRTSYPVTQSIFESLVLHYQERTELARMVDHRKRNGWHGVVWYFPR